VNSLIQAAAANIQNNIVREIREGDAYEWFAQFLIKLGRLDKQCSAMHPDNDVHPCAECVSRDHLIEAHTARFADYLQESGAIARAVILAATEEDHVPVAEHLHYLASETANAMQGDAIYRLSDAVNKHLTELDHDAVAAATSTAAAAFMAAIQHAVETNVRQIAAEHLSAITVSERSDAWKADIRAITRVFEVVSESESSLTVRVLRASLGLERGTTAHLVAPSVGGSIGLAIVDDRNRVIAHRAHATRG
jgi:hypothetical protein